MSEADLYKLFSQYDGGKPARRTQKERKGKVFRILRRRKVEIAEKTGLVSEAPASAGLRFFVAGGRWKCERAGTGRR